MEPVHQQGPRRFWPDRDIKQQQVDLGIPEDMAEIRIPGKSARADRYTVILGVRGAGQMVYGESKCLLQFVIALDEDVARDPARMPSRLVLGQHGAPAQRAAAPHSGMSARG